MPSEHVEQKMNWYMDEGMGRLDAVIKAICDVAEIMGHNRKEVEDWCEYHRPRLVAMLPRLRQERADHEEMMRGVSSGSSRSKQ